VRGLDEQDARRENQGQASGACQSPFSPERDALRELYGITAREYRGMIQHFSGQRLFLHVILTMLLVRISLFREAFSRDNADKVIQLTPSAASTHCHPELVSGSFFLLGGRWTVAGQRDFHQRSAYFSKPPAVLRSRC